MHSRSGGMQSILKNYQVILESIEEGVFTVNQEWKIMSFNRAAERITGFSRKEAIGRRCSDIFRTSVCGNGCFLRKTIQTGKPLSNMPVVIVRADGKKIPISVNTAVLSASDGTIIGGVEIFRDLSAFSELKKAYFKEHSFEDIVSKSEKMLRYFSILPQIAASDSTVLVNGATGTGKEFLARAIHNHSGRRKGPFVAVNCGALPDTLIESELFGYKACAFTDAKKDKAGVLPWPKTALQPCSCQAPSITSRKPNCPPSNNSGNLPSPWPSPQTSTPAPVRCTP